MWETLLKVLYPDKCVICHSLLTLDSEVAVCRRCAGKLQPLTEPRCKRCSKQLVQLEEELCSDCRERQSFVERGMAVYPYDEQMQKAIVNFKYGGEISGGLYFAREMVRMSAEWIWAINPDVILPVPVHKSRLRFRGFNQAEYLAKEVGQELGIPVRTDYLIRTTKTLPQKGLDVKQRMNNLQKGFGITGSCEPYRNILLVDDIYTTGATVEACARVLKKAGARKIYFLCLCIGRGD